MNACFKTARLAAIALCMLAISSVTYAQRTFVASTGSDMNPCSRPSPCRNLQAGVNAVAAGGEVVALDSAGYGTVTINKAVTINTPSGVYAGVAVASNSVGITVTAGATDAVVIINVQFNGSGASNAIGIQHNSGKLAVINCNFTQLTTAVFDNGAKLDLVNNNFSGNTTAIKTDGTGSNFDPNIPVIGPTMVRLAGGNIVGNTNAFVIANPGAKPCSPPNNANCYPNCSFGMNPYCTAPSNKIPILVFRTGNSFLVNIAGNGTIMSGTGTGCTNPDPMGSPFCTASSGIFSYQDTYNPN